MDKKSKYTRGGDREFFVGAPWWGTPLLVRFWAWELKMSTLWYYPPRRRPWHPDFWEAPYPWRLWLRRYVSGFGYECAVLTWGWFSLHHKGRKVW